MIKLNMQNIRQMKMPVGYGDRPISLFRLRGSVSSKNQVPYAATHFQLRVDNQGKNLYTSRKLHCNTFISNKLDVNSSLHEEDKFNLDLHESPDLIKGFRTACNKQEQFLTDQLQTVMKRVEPMTNQEWDGLKNVLLKMTGNINDKNIDAIIMNKCAELECLPLGKSYFKYLKFTKKTINRATYGNYLRLFCSCINDCTSDDLNEIDIIYKELIEVYPLLDSRTAEKAVCALSLTENWKEYEKLFIAIKQFYNPSIYIYRIVIETAFDHQEFELGWKLMEEMQCQGQNVPDEVFLYWFQKVKFRKSYEDLSKVLNFFIYFNIKPSNDVCKGIKEAFEMCNEKGKVAFTRITRHGECRCCLSKLEPCYVSQEDYEELKKAFLNPVLIGRDMFQKTKPEEFKQFLNFLEESAPFNVVIDGLNVALQGYKRSVSDCTFRLKSVVKHFVTLNKRVLLLGRKHMATWHTHDMEYVNNNTHVFLTDNLSQDDPFMLYAALYSGFGTYFVSRDMMRGHKFLLADPKLQITFQKWQSQHQYFIVNIERNGKVYFQEPVSFLQTIQQNSKGDWHIPYIFKGEELSIRDKVDHLHRHWLCLQTNPVVVAQRTWQQEPRIKQSKTWETTRPIKKSTGSISIKELFQDDK